MDNSQLQKVGILTTSTKLLLSAPNRCLFAQITAFLILPYSLLFFLHTYLSGLLSHNGLQLLLQTLFSGLPSGDALQFLLFKSLSVLALLFLSLLPLSAVTFFAASLLAGANHLSFSPKFLFSFKRVLLTLLTVLLLLCFLSLFCLLLVYIMAYFFGDVLGIGLLVLVPTLAVAWSFLVQVFHLGNTWLMASVVSVLEDSADMFAVDKSEELIEAERDTATGVYVTMVLSFLAVDYGFSRFVLFDGMKLGLGRRLGLGLAMLAFMNVIILFLLVSETVVYLVCKSKREGVDMMSLKNWLELAGTGNSEPKTLKQKGVQLEQNYRVDINIVVRT